MFGEDKKPNWLFLSASLLMISWSPMMDMMSMGIILENGYSSLWVLRDRFWLAGVPAILFASMWAKLKFQTDNELLRLRYSGKSAVVMHVFRAAFLSIFVIPLFASFLILALIKFVDVLGINTSVSTNTIITIGVLLLVLKNSFHQKIRTDTLSALLCIIAPFFVCWFIFQEYGGVADMYQTLRADFPEKTNLFPSFEPAEGKSTLSNFIVFIGIQWWSVYIIDNSDPNAQRHFQAKNRFFAFKALFVPILISSLMFLLISVIWDAGIIEYAKHDPNTIDTEAFYLEVALMYVPVGFKALIVIAFMFSFITTLESIINWGAGLLTVDIFKTYLYKNGSDRDYRYLSFGMMTSVSIISLAFAFHTDKLFTLQKFIFSISAGVAPVFLLRWFWWRINAWTQISAMVSSLVYTLIFDHLYATHSGFQNSIDALCHATMLSYYPLKLIILTTLVVATWLTVMYSTQPDTKEQLEKFYKATGTGGFWPKEFGDNGYQLKKKIGICLLFAVTYILPYLFVWQFKFGSPVYATILVFAFIFSAALVYRAMVILLPEH
jgi:Na+/proline symporter